MKQLEMRSAIYDQETMEYVQRMLRVEITDEEAELFAKLKESICERTGLLFPFKQYGFCNNGEEVNIESPLAEIIRDSNGKPHHRFNIVMDLHTYDPDDEPGKGCGWIYL